MIYSWVKLIHSIYFMHLTNRQTLSGLVLSFYAKQPKTSIDGFIPL